MNPVSRSPYRDLRANQKERTRAALVDAAKALVRAGAPPTVAEAAERARVSRATAYRYFPTQDSQSNGQQLANVVVSVGP